MSVHPLFHNSQGKHSLGRPTLSAQLVAEVRQALFRLRVLRVGQHALQVTARGLGAARGIRPVSDIAELLSTLRERDVRLWVEDDRLKCSAPEGALDVGMRATLVVRKR